jgi:hypothetical protein
VNERLLTSLDAKTTKGEALGYLTGILYMLPHLASGLGNVCRDASPECIALCLNTAGRGEMSSVQEGRMRKTKLFFAGSAAFVDLLRGEVARLVKRAAKRNLTPCVRLNGTSDIPWERMRGSDGRTIFECYPDVQFYDYTKRADRWNLPANYHLTFSRSERNEPACMETLARGRNVAVVFSTRKGTPLPTFWRGYRIIDGDVSDLRFQDASSERAVVVGLRAKGRAKKLVGGFVVNAENMA